MTTSGVTRGPSPGLPPASTVVQSIDSWSSRSAEPSVRCQPWPDQPSAAGLMKIDEAWAVAGPVNTAPPSAGSSSGDAVAGAAASTSRASATRGARRGTAGIAAAYQGKP